MRSDPQSLEHLTKIVRQENGTYEESHSLEQQERILSSWVRSRKSPSQNFVRLKLAMASASAIIAIGLCIGLYQLSTDSLMNVRIDGKRPVAGNGLWIDSRDEKTIPLSFDDGSKISLTKNSAMRISDSTVEEMSIELVDGKLCADIKKGNDTKWSFRAGPYSLTVLGTKFDLDWNRNRSKLKLEMRNGSILVKGKGIDPSGIRIGDNDRLLADPNTGLVALNPRTEVSKDIVVSQEGTPTQKHPQAISSSGVLSESIEPELTPLDKKSKESKKEKTPRWKQLIDYGNFKEALSAAQEGKFETTLNSASAEDLWILGNTARQTKKHKVALKILRAFRERFPGSNRANTSAFITGKILMDNLNDCQKAAHYFRVYLTKTPGGPLDEESRGRLIVALNKIGSDAAAHSEAESYIAQYPNGAYATAAKKILEKPSN